MQLTHRERRLVVGLAVVVGAWALFALGIRPATERIETLNRVIPEKQMMLEELRKKSAEYLALRASLGGYKRKAASVERGFELLAFLESMTTKLHLAKKVAKMKQKVSQLDANYCETTVEIELESLTLKQLVEFLIKTKSSDHLLRIKSLFAKKDTTNPNLIDTVIQISTLRLNERM